MPRRGKHNGYDLSYKLLCPDVGIYRCFITFDSMMWVIIDVVSNGRLPQNCMDCIAYQQAKQMQFFAMTLYCKS